MLDPKPAADGPGVDVEYDYVLDPALFAGLLEPGTLLPLAGPGQPFAGCAGKEPYPSCSSR